jgi:predicted RNA binding protein YcfA (HicA-like mRNA interferase family)
MPSVNSREIIRELRANGWFQVAQRGSHVQFRHMSKPGRVTVPHPKKDLPPGTVANIRRQAGLKGG